MMHGQKKIKLYVADLLHYTC